MVCSTASALNFPGWSSRSLTRRGNRRTDFYGCTRSTTSSSTPIWSCSARTGLGKEIRGEGLIGLTRGFMYSGAPRVVASLWGVDDLATAELMKLFYQRMLKDGLPAGSALRAAQLELSGQKRWASPYFWAGFVLQGEWK